MAEHDCISEVTISKAQRRYKIGYTSIRHSVRATKMTTYYSRTPSLHLKGDWLEEAGFTTDTPVTVAVERGQLMIRPAE
ncbi:type I toxin-antitoxin system SymE family toxin [Enterobacteriaceae bacterium H18W14]|uniref:SymE family type I addiction module toxin n=1 Tax=Dryocola boscaweniae TaxID=2925397 RepID=UPI0022F040F8|nr:SymE family type I addiction module toxin [Dryocola boscaweniae]MCT4715607.1 type I toxin-antitoxin system SymE family toxin [Dryocola boscaweniae]